jgi:PAS domain S-box-containing protein
VAVLAFWLLAAFVAWSGVLAHHHTKRVYENGRLVAEAHARTAASARLLSLMQDAETGQRGYLLTGEESYLAPYTKATRDIAAHLDKLASLGSLGPEEDALVSRMRAAAAIKLAELAETVALRREQGFEAARAVVLTDRGRQAMLEIRSAAEAIGDLEREELARRAEQSQQSYRSALLARVLATLIGLGLIFGAYRLTDRNARERADHAALRHEQAERFRVTLSSIGDAVIVTDAEAKVRFMNPVAVDLTGWEAWEGQAVTDVFRIRDETSGHAGKDPVRKVLSEGKVVGLENHTVLVKRSGETVPIDDSAAPIFGADGQITGVVLVFRDITERRKAERLALRQKEALEEGDRRKDEFLAMLAHELRNPLAALRNAIEVLRRVKGDSPEGEQARAIIQRQVQQMARMVDDLIDVARISSGRMILRRAPTPIREVVEAATETTAALFEERRHGLQLRLPEAPVFVDGDSVRLAQVLTNLLNNAAKYTEAGGRIELEVAEADHTLVISVRDNGVGISEELRPHVFDLFRQGHRSRGGLEGGLGIGLNLARRIVELHGGTIEAASPGVGRGSTFVVTLPVSRPPDERLAQAPSAPVGAHRVLVVEDNRDVRQAFETFLRLAGCEIVGVSRGDEALSEAKRFQPTVALVDLGLPDMTGYEVARRLREDSSLAGIHLIALTGWAQEGDRRDSVAAGFDHHLVKPVEPDSLLTLIASLSIPRGGDSS